VRGTQREPSDLETRVESERPARSLDRPDAVALAETSDGDPGQGFGDLNSIGPIDQRLQLFFRIGKRPALQKKARIENEEPWRATEASKGDAKNLFRIVDSLETQEGLAEAGPAFHEIRGDLRESKELLARVLQCAALEEPTREIEPCRNEAGVNPERSAIVALGVQAISFLIGKQTKCVVRRREIGIQVTRFDESTARALEIAAMQLDESEIDPRLGEAWAVLESEGHASFGHRQVALRERHRTVAVQGNRFGRQGRSLCAAGEPDPESEAGRSKHRLPDAG
jgi:hypothetical protein